jgi:hypothetical protein
METIEASRSRCSVLRGWVCGRSRQTLVIRRSRQASAVVRTTGSLGHAGFTLLATMIGPAFRGRDRYLESLRRSIQRPALVHDTLREAQSAGRAQLGVAA